MKAGLNTYPGIGEEITASKKELSNAIQRLTERRKRNRGTTNTKPVKNEEEQEKYRSALEINVKQVE